MRSHKKKFPLLKYKAATENLCQALEAYGDDESIVKAKAIRNIAINHTRKGVGKKINDNLSDYSAKILKKTLSNQQLSYAQLTKGRAIATDKLIS